MTTKNKKYFYCKRTRLMEYLIRCGHNIVAIVEDQDEPSRVVFKFNYNESLQHSLDRYSNR